ncbi:hypothetical protein RJT34_21573 [Clitoria ternatea]|uniref:Uncharacterized protein n=1 Tax=Clitoria ternatea TaxID=43366 RepID=A0AAN9P5W6_CLITE
MSDDEFPGRGTSSNLYNIDLNSNSNFITTDQVDRMELNADLQSKGVMLEGVTGAYTLYVDKLDCRELERNLSINQLKVMINEWKSGPAREESAVEIITDAVGPLNNEGVSSSDIAGLVGEGMRAQDKWVGDPGREIVKPYVACGDSPMVVFAVNTLNANLVGSVHKSDTLKSHVASVESPVIDFGVIPLQDKIVEMNSCEHVVVGGA